MNASGQSFPASYDLREVRGSMAVACIPFFGSPLQVTPYVRSLVPDGIFVPQEGGRPITS